MRVVHYAYCGMSIPLGSGYTAAEARARIARRIAWFKERIGGAVVYHGGFTYELCEPDPNYGLVPDACGTLTAEPEPRKN